MRGKGGDDNTWLVLRPAARTHLPVTLVFCFSPALSHTELCFRSSVGGELLAQISNMRGLSGDDTSFCALKVRSLGNAGARPYIVAALHVTERKSCPPYRLGCTHNYHPSTTNRVNGYVDSAACTSSHQSILRLTCQMFMYIYVCCS